MNLRHTPINAGRAVPTAEAFAIYALRHTPTGNLYIGSTINLRSRLNMWWYAIGNPKTTAKIPARFSNVFISHGRNPHDWTYAVISWDKPEGWTPKAPPERRPEWPYIQWANAHVPAQLLNDPTGARRGNTQTERPYSRVGVSPMVYLGAKLGLNRQAGKFDTQPGFDRPVDMRELAPACVPTVSFATFLYYSMKLMRSLNPSAPAIAGLYVQWLRNVRSDDPVRSYPVPTSVQAALDLPTPLAYVVAPAS